MKKLLILFMVLASCSPKISNPTKSEVKQKKFVVIWTITGAVIIACAVQNELDRSDKPRQ